MQLNSHLLKAYVSDVSTLVNEMDAILKKRNSVSSLDKESVDALFRIFHTIKASAIVLNDSKTIDVSYKMENIVAYLRKHGPDALPFQQVIKLMFESEYFFRSQLNRMSNTAHVENTEEFEGLLDSFVNAIDFKEDAPTNYMVPFDQFKFIFQNVIDEMSKELDKKVELQFEGEKLLYLDRQILTRLTAPLTQIVRNAMDHGIEPPVERILKGKPEVGVITVTYGVENGIMFITIFNDGEKLNLKKILRRADKLHILTKPRDQYKPEEIAELIMERGFTTREVPCQYSGRGVGMDIIKSTAKDMGGKILINTGETDGFSMTFTFPISAASQKDAIEKMMRGDDIDEQ
ncbi:MAG: hypothetical protein GX241_02540 [Ruminococcaceae bacterium]|nr:hypothetical protein [Oscillospiraceae bacterium]